MVEQVLQQIKSAEAEIKEKARNVYLILPIVRLATVAKRSGASIEQIRKWSEEGRWVELRSKMHSDKHAEIIKRVGSPREAMLRELELLNEIEEVMKCNIAIDKNLVHAFKRDPQDFAQYMNVLTKIHDLRNRLYKELTIGIKAEVQTNNVTDY